MKEIIELNKRLIEMAGKSSSENVLFLERNDNLSEETRLPSALQAGIEELRGKINQIVPNDFEYCLALGDESPSFMIGYRDGAQTESFRGRIWAPDCSILEQLEGLDWNGERQDAIAGCQIFDAMKERAKEIAPDLPSTKELQKAFRDDMKAYLKEQKRNGASGVHVMTWREDEGVKDEFFESLEAFEGDLIDLMPTRYFVIAVVVDGKALSAEKIEAMKKKALKELEEHMPISHARALGKF